MTHKKCNKPLDDIYELLQVGSALNQDLSYTRDDTGDNISDLNPYFGELTGYYWLWKNVSDVEIVGICHYRRYFGIDGKILTSHDCETLLKDCDIVCSNIVKTEYQNYKIEFSKAHNIKDLLLVRDAISNLYTEDLRAFDEALEADNHTYGNLCIMRKEVFDSYCEWLFNNFMWMIDKVDFTGYDSYHKRLFGFLSENLIRVFAKSRNLKVKPGKVYVTEEKVETKELKIAVFQLMKDGKLAEAKEMFISYLRYRPDVVLPLSDISGELNMLASIINFIENNDSSEIYKHMDSLGELIDYYKSLKK